MDIFVTLDLTERQMARLREVSGTDRLHVHDLYADDAPLESDFAVAEVAFGPVPPDWLARTPALRWLQLESVGFNQYRGLDWPRLGRQIAVTNLAGFFAAPVAETALAGILALYRGLDRLLPLQAAKDWVGDALRPELRVLAGAKVVLFGRGAINRHLAGLLEPFGCAITGFGRDWTAEALDAALAEADILVSTVPETDATIGVFDAARLARLKPTALFVNLGRGSVIDEAALASCLAEGRLAGAVLDVTLEEPLPTDHPFWSSPNTILTQHSGGGSDDETDRKIEVFAENLARYRAGEPLAGLVDFAKGY